MLLYVLLANMVTIGYKYQIAHAGICMTGQHGHNWL